MLCETPGHGTGRLSRGHFPTGLPVCGAGVILSPAISEAIERVDRVYFFDLLVAAGGCLLLVPFLNYFGGPGTILASAALFAAGGAIWQGAEESLARRLNIGWATALVACLL